MPRPYVGALGLNLAVLLLLCHDLPIRCGRLTTPNGGAGMDITGILGLLNPLGWIERGYRYLRRPKLHVYFDANQTYRTRPLADLGGTPGFFCHLMVRNDGREAAKACQGRLIEVNSRGPDGKYQPHPDFVNPVVLKWANEPDFGPRNIDPDRPRRLDLCYTVQATPGVLEFFTHKVPTGNRTDFPPGAYRVKVRIDSENAVTVDGTFIVSYAGIWNQVQVAEGQP